ncbi:hypothetical protein [Streptomyces spectabilis]|uniref:Uncharacterized protein n=1 Tax=Streptomyces spectabilis TaxID=68270 RepID=A0A5P2X4R1_STRST|nr:hypothetical protein [Streptomyces spectabilis]MBB5109051.1 hypothetical protein [Streptomyces spectabilis]MCI3902694.1 hypothetical protein [Streptomyces spectabilis]QEV60003.1 hypothetical protein CP982_15700 [Streptomyces spectabilis]
MAGSGEDWLSDGLGIVDGDFGMWVPGVDYLAGWREAREVADRLNRAFLGAGFELSEVRCVASTDEGGRGLVRLAGSPSAVARLAGLLESAVSGGDV